jgi:hypothetical protein
VKEHNTSGSKAFAWKDNKDGFKLIAGYFAVVSIVSAIYSAFGEKRPIGGFFEEFVATMAYWVVLFGSIWVGGWLGTKTFEKWDSKLLGWLIGLLAFGMFIGTVDYAVGKIPGVNWRFERLFTSRGNYE